MVDQRPEQIIPPSSQDLCRVAEGPFATTGWAIRTHVSFALSWLERVRNRRAGNCDSVGE